MGGSVDILIFNLFRPTSPLQIRFLERWNSQSTQNITEQKIARHFFVQYCTCQKIYLKNTVFPNVHYAHLNIVKLGTLPQKLHLSKAELGARSCRPFAWRVPAFFHFLFAFRVPACFFKAFFLRTKIRVPEFLRSKFCNTFQFRALEKIKFACDIRPKATLSQRTLCRMRH